MIFNWKVVILCQLKKNSYTVKQKTAYSKGICPIIQTSMAIITKIREKSGIAAAAIAISLILFLIGDDIFRGSSNFFGGTDRTVLGEISGEKIKTKDFDAKLQIAIENFKRQRDAAPSDQDLASIREQVWNQYIIDYAYKGQYEELGLKVSPEELVDMVQGKNIHPSVMQQFTDPKTGVFDKNVVIQFLQNLKKAPADQQQQWNEFEKYLLDDRLRTKYENLMKLSSITNSLEAKKEYVGQTAKADANYLFVPFYSIADSTIKVEDSQLKEYMQSHADLYKSQDTRTIEYVTFPIIPTKADTSAFQLKLNSLAKELGRSSNDSSFAFVNSDKRIPYSLSLADIPESIKSQMSNFIVGGIYGPFKIDDAYSVLKYDGVKADKFSSLRASHILISPSNKTDSAKAQARAKAESILNQIKGGASFETMAQINGSDATAQRGGDLGFFKNNGSMVKPFEEAVFGFSGKGLLPRLVETDFGFHIIKVTEAKSNLFYKMAVISKVIAPSQSTLDAVYRKAEEFASANGTKAAFDIALKKDKSLVMMKGERIQENATSINFLQNARQIVQWAFDEETEVNQASQKVFEVDNQYTVAVVTAKTSKDAPTVADFKDELTFKVKNQLKSEQILKKLGTISGTLEQMAQKYGAGALVEKATGITLNTGSLNSAGQDPIALGKIFGAKVGKKTKAFVGEGGVFVVEKTSTIQAPEIADLTMYKKSITNRTLQSTPYFLGEAIKDNAKIVDNRAKFY